MYRKRRVYIDTLKAGHCLTCSIVLYSYASGNSIGTIHFVWRTPDEVTAAMLTEGNHECMRKIQPMLPIYHTRAMKIEFFGKISLFSGITPAALRAVYKTLTGMYRFS